MPKQATSSQVPAKKSAKAAKSSAPQRLCYAVLGGAGAMGRITVTDLAHTAEPQARILVADYDLAKAQALIAGLAHPGLEAVQVDIRKPEQVMMALQGSTVLLNSLPYAFNLEVMELALKLGAHYTDLGGLFHMTRRQRALTGRFQAAGLTALLGIGAAPGITNLLARLAVDQMESVEAVHVRLGTVDKTRYKKPMPVLPVSYSFKTILEEFSLQPAVFSKGKLRFLKPMAERRPYRFPAPVGEQWPMHTLHSEILMHESFAAKGIREVSFKIAFDKDFVERVQFLRDLGLADQEALLVNGQSVAPIDLVNLVVMKQPAPEAVGESKQYEILRSIIQGQIKGQPVTCLHDCHTAGMPAWGIGTDIDTGSPPAVAAQMIAAGQISLRGALYPEEAIDPMPFFKALERRGMFLKTETKKGWQVPM
ncbi:MAG: hypothetical protein CVV27_12725 [Candidatus Melainabacteria bacterium HGW-Melainabacteria-1]|nr:MAG: hypothetical protein CVV27_12725 [Candidatus Melainabacteria bacterium HGW-Melainabacteria-1]